MRLGRPRAATELMSPRLPKSASPIQIAEPNEPPGRNSGIPRGLTHHLRTSFLSKRGGEAPVVEGRVKSSAHFRDSGLSVKAAILGRSSRQFLPLGLGFRLPRTCCSFV